MRVLRLPGRARRLQRSRAIQGGHHAADRVGTADRVATDRHADHAPVPIVTPDVSLSSLKQPALHRRLLMSRQHRLGAVLLIVLVLRGSVEAVPPAPTN